MALETVTAPSQIKTKEQERLLYIDLLRILASFFIVVLHTAANDMYRCKVNTFYWQAFNFFNSSGRWAVPVFVMISGVLFLDHSKNITIKRMFSKYISRLFVVYFFWSFFYAVFNNAPVYDHVNVEIIKKVLLDTLKGPTHFWYIPMICGLYLITPFLRILIHNSSKGMLEYFILLCFIFTNVIPTLKSLQIVPPVMEFAGSLKVSFAAGYVGYFALGYYLNSYPLKPLIRRLLYVSGLVCFLITVLGTSLLSAHAGKLDKTFYNNLSPNCLIMSAALFVFFKEHMKNVRFSAATEKHIRKISYYSFGIYILHLFSFIIFSAIKFNIADYNPVFAVPVLAIAIFLASLFITFLLSKIPVVNKYLI